MKKKVIVGIVFLFVIILCSTSFADTIKYKDYMYEVKGKGIKIIKYLGTETGILTVPSEIDNKPVTIIGRSSFHSCPAEKIILPDNIKTIEETAFTNAKCREVQFPKTDSKITMGTFCFSNCPELESIHLPASVEFKKNTPTMGYIGLFSNTPKLKSITFDGESKLYVFSDNALIIKKGMILIGYLTGQIQDRILIIPDGIKSIGSGVLQNIECKSVIIPDSVTNIESIAFIGSTFEHLTIGSGMKKIDYAAFAHNPELKTVVIAEGTTSIGDEAFYNCPALESIVIPSSVKKIGKKVFGNNYQVKIITPAKSAAEKYAKKNGLEVITQEE